MNYVKYFYLCSIIDRIVNKTLTLLKINPMKIISLLFTLLISSSYFSQIKTVDISDKNIGSLHCRYFKSINLDKNDTTYIVFISYQNKEYSAITDLKSIFISESDSLTFKEFIDVLKKALPEMETKTSIGWRKDKYEINLYDFSKELYLSEPLKKGKGYCTLKKADVIKLISWLESFKFGIG